MKTFRLALLLALSAWAPAPADDRPAPATPPVPSKSLPAAVAPAPAPAPEAAETHRTLKPVAAPPAAPRPAAGPVIEVVFTYGSEKQKWIEAVTGPFNASGRTLPSGERVRVTPIPVGSGELIDEVLTERRKAHLVSPAAEAFILRGNAESREQGHGDLVGPTKELVRSPIVVAMWRDMAEAAGWPGKTPGWRDIFGYARDAARWQAVARPEWGGFRLAHTQPESSNSGLHAIFLEAYAAAGKFEDFARADVSGRPEVDAYLREVEKAVPFYETSTGFLARRMVREGRKAISAAIVYENLVIEANQEAKRIDPSTKLPQVVAIYPAEGTFPTEHPVGIVERPWVTAKHREAAELYVAYLLERPRQEEAKRSGFRPADPSIDVSDILTPDMGVDPAQPRHILHPPPASAIRLILDTWRRDRNPAAAPASGR